MSEIVDTSVGLGGGALIAVATQAAGLDASAPLFIGAGAGMVLALSERSRTTGLALIAASVVGAIVIAARPRRARARV